MEASVSQKEKIAAAKKKLKRFQQKSARLEKVHVKIKFNSNNDSTTLKFVVKC